ncbi:MAG TPA: acyl-CoA dehydrogenase family protein [Kofleriaceae bacterium]|nr:acyl-CoA dehydrogenase family protein [Kofleriaceae bacterium]
MRFAFTEEQDELRRSVRRVLDAAGGIAAARRAAQAPEVRGASSGNGGHDATLWKTLARELGLAGLAVPERHGGAGLGWVEVIGVMEEMGRTLAPVPFLSSSVLATAALLSCGTEDQQAAILPPLARGDVTATLAWLEVGGHADPASITTTARPAPGGHVLLDGRKRFVLDGHAADLLLVVARDPGTTGASGLALYEVPAGASGLRRHRLPTMDATRALAEVVLSDVRVPAASRLGDASSSTGGWPAIARALARGHVALAAEQVGGAQRCLDLGVEYAKVRHQFGRPIGSFQAIQHNLAELFVLVESARSAAYYAGWAADHATDDEADETAACAAAFCADAFFHCAAETIQVHGGIGFTWEHDAHLYFKRARAGKTLLGTPADHRESIARRIFEETR